MKKRGIVAVIVLLLIGLDQLVKSYIVQQIPLGEVRSWIPNFVSLTYLQNRGAAFSILQDQQLLFAVITLVVVVGAIWYLHKHMEDSINFAIFNVADSYLTVGVIILLIAMLKEEINGN